MSEQDLRLSDAERDLAAGDLAEHYAQGRLTTEEHGERLDRIWAARTRAELAPVFWDLPGPRQGWAGTPAARPGRPLGRPAASPARRRGLPVPVLVVLAILVAITVVTHLPLIVLGLLLWWFLAARHHRGPRVHRW